MYTDIKKAFSVNMTNYMECSRNKENNVVIENQVHDK